MSADFNVYLSKVYLEKPADCSLSSQEMMSNDVRISKALLKVSTDDDVHADITVVLITKKMYNVRQGTCLVFINKCLTDLELQATVMLDCNDVHADILAQGQEQNFNI